MTPDTLEASVTEETSAAVETATTAKGLASRDPGDETTALRRQQQQTTAGLAAAQETTGT